MALESLVEIHIEIVGDFEAGKPFLDKLVDLYPEDLLTIRYRIIYDCCSEEENVTRAEKAFLKLIERDHDYALWHGLYDYFEDDYTFLGDRIRT